MFKVELPILTSTANGRGYSGLFDGPSPCSQVPTHGPFTTTDRTCNHEFEVNPEMSRVFVSEVCQARHCTLLGMVSTSCNRWRHTISRFHNSGSTWNHYCGKCRVEPTRTSIVKGNKNNNCLKSYYIRLYLAVYFHFHNTEQFIRIQLTNNSK